MSKICLLSLVFAPDGVSTSILMTELAQELQAQGHEITVLTTTPHYNVEPEARKRQPLTPLWGGLLYKSDLNGITVYHASIPVKGSRVGARLFDYLRFHAISTLAGIFMLGKVDLFFVPTPPLTIGLSAWILSIFKRAPFVFNVQEIYPDIAVSLGVLKNKGLIRFFEALEMWTYRRAGMISVISERFRNALLAKGVSNEKICVIPNFVDTDFIQPGPRHNDFSAKHYLDDKFVVLYAGNIGLTQGFETILATAKLMTVTWNDRMMENGSNPLSHNRSVVTPSSEIFFLIVGDGTRRAWLEKQLADGDYPNVILLPYQPRSVVPNIYATADVCLVPLKKETALGTFPSKTYTIMAAQRPVIASTDQASELADLVKRADCGWVVEPEDVASLTQAILNAANHPHVSQEKGVQGYQHIRKNYGRQAVTLMYDSLFKQMLPNGPTHQPHIDQDIQSASAD